MIIKEIYKTNLYLIKLKIYLKNIILQVSFVLDNNLGKNSGILEVKGNTKGLV